jgi:sugar diacid utilization regulator
MPIVARAATALHVHQTTVRHRLDRIHASTGHDPRTFRGLADLLCAVETLHDSPTVRLGTGQNEPVSGP